MGGRGILRVLLLASALVAGLSAVAAQAQESAYYGPRLIEERVRIPAQNGNTIAATVLRPEAQGPFGAIILNHGVSASARERARESSDLLINAAAVFARRGYVVVMPLRRGFGATGGDMAEDPGSCSNPDYRTAESNAADDVMAAYDYARSLPYVDGNRMMLAGQSAGGMVALYTAGMRQPQGLQAVLAFAAGRGGDPEINPGIPCAIEPVARIFDTVGKQIRVPVLMNYAENDLFFSPKISRQWFERLNASWSDAEYALQPSFGKDGHYLFGDTLGVRYWLPTVETFLARHSITFARLDATDPERAPLLALERVPNIKSDACKSLYRAFLESPGPRAYAVSGDGRCGFAGGLQDARDVAVKQCSNVAKSNCMLYAVDDAVIWKDTIAGQGGATPAAR
ncbi:MAG: prolyl oligopeptidase family serine peptidase [Betaproteobacteria bacterium]|nr:prolyl oligopeptidase family serine peptidase [Betaproteobacteria bacterium]